MRNEVGAGVRSLFHLRSIRVWLFRVALLVGWLAGSGAPAQAQVRPDEEALFGAPPAATPPAPTEAAPVPRSPATAPVTPQPSAAAPPTGGILPDAARDAALLGGGGSWSSAGDQEQAPDDPLRIGGQLYWRGQAGVTEEMEPGEVVLAAPALLDLYLDARPNSLLRGYVRTRLRYDPTATPMYGPLTYTGGAAVGGEEDPDDPQKNPAWFTFQEAGMQLALDQLWFNLNLGQAVFVTVGRQHVKWGPARFWNPTDFLHQAARDPLALFDARTGATLIKVHVPWERRGWNLYGIALLEGPGTVDTLQEVGAGGRLELLLGPAEVGLDTLLQRERARRFGLDLSTPVGPLDVYGEVALLHGEDKLQTAPGLASLLGGGARGSTGDGFRVAATAGFEYTWKYNDEDTLTLGGEYFFQQDGADGEVTGYRGLLFAGRFTPFYLGRHYAGLFALLAAPGSWNDTTIILSNLGNLSDRSFVTRLDWTVRILTHLTLETFVAAHYGTRGGEFRFGLELPAGYYDGAGEYLGSAIVPNATYLPYAHLRMPILEAGLGLRMGI